MSDNEKICWMNNKSRKADTKFYVLVAIGTIFAAAGFFSPPIGQIGNSVLIWCGECLVLAGAVLGINLHFNIKEILSLNEEDKKTDN